MRNRLWRRYLRACAGRGWRARRATAGLIRALRSTRHHDHRSYAAELLLEVVQSARAERARAMARAAVDAAWADAGAARDHVWRLLGGEPRLAGASPEDTAFRRDGTLTGAHHTDFGAHHTDFGAGDAGGYDSGGYSGFSGGHF